MNQIKMLKLLFLLMFYGWPGFASNNIGPLPTVCEQILENLELDGVEVLGITSVPEGADRPELSQYTYGGQLFPQKIFNQCQFGSCWAAVGKAAVETAADQNKTYFEETGENLEISLEYLVATKLINTFGKQLKGYIQPLSGQRVKGFVVEGGSVFDAFEAMRKFGFIPSNQWVTKRKFGQNKVHDSRLVNNLRLLQKKFYDEVDQLRIVYHRLKDLGIIEQGSVASAMNPSSVEQGGGADFLLGRLGLKKGESLPSRFEDLHLLKKHVARYESKAWTLLVAYLGRPPDKVTLLRQEYTPLEFSKLDYFRSDVWSNTNDPLFRTNRRPTDRSFELIKELLAYNMFIPVGLVNSAALSDPSLAEFSVGSFNLSGIVAEEYVNETMAGPYGGLHVMQIVDYYDDWAGNRWLLLKNSWGEGSGKNGYYHISWTNFKLLFKSVYILRSYIDRW